MGPGFALRALLCLWLLAANVNVQADELKPAYLELRQVGAQTYDVTWKVPARGDSERLALYVRFSEGAVNVSEPRGASSGSSHIERWRMRQPGGLNDKEISIDGLRRAPPRCSCASRAPLEAPSATL